MHLLQSFVPAVLLAAGHVAAAASSWGYEDATLSVYTKGAGTVKDKFSPAAPLKKSISFGPADTLKLLLTTIDGKEAKRPHQAFLTLTVPTTGVQDTFPLAVKDTGKGRLELTHKDLPSQLLKSTEPLTAALVIGSFGSSSPFHNKVFDLTVKPDENVPLPVEEAPVRYGKLEEIHHIFRADPKSPPKIITLFFTAVVLATVPILLGAWLALGGNVNHLSKALQAAPISHTLFFGSIVAIEGIFFLYYTTWNLFQTLPAALAVGVVAFISGSRALTEVQERRLAGLR